MAGASRPCHLEDATMMNRNNGFYEVCHQYANGFITRAEFHAALAAYNCDMTEIPEQDAMTYIGEIADTFDPGPDFMPGF